MAPGWEMGFGFGMDMDAPSAPYMYNAFPSPAAAAAAAAGGHLLPTPPNNSAAPHLPSGHSFDGRDPQSGGGSSFPDDLCFIPCEEASELEWLSQFVEDSYSDIPYPTPAAVGGGGGTVPSSAGHHVANAAWSCLASQPTLSSSPTASSSSSTSEFFSRQKSRGGRRRSGGGTGDLGRDDQTRGRRCTHCASEKTPQWRTGPLGPKTLCNACGVRYKSGRLVPEYRPAASPTFVLTEHSNSHRKVMELRRQKDIFLRHDGRSSSDAGGDGRPELLFHDYEVC